MFCQAGQATFVVFCCKRLHLLVGNRLLLAVTEEAHNRIRIAVEVHAEALVAVMASRVHQVLVVDDLL